MRAQSASPVFIEPCESRRLFSCAADIGLSDPPPDLSSAIDLSFPLSRGITRGVTHGAAPTVPNIRRTYSGSYSLATGLSGTFKLVVRKELRAPSRR